jgi:hypothetical protein
LARNVTLSQLRTDIADQADITGAVGASSRYTPTQLNRLINQSLQRFREKISNEGATRYLTSATGSLAVGATSPYPFYVLDLSAASPSIVRTYGLDITVNNVTRTLKHVSFKKRGEYGGPNYTGIPEAWAHYVGNKLAIFPPSSGTYVYVCWYLPVLADLSADGDTFDGVAGWEDFIVWDCVCRLIIKDQYPQAYQMATAERAQVWADIIRQATRVSDEGGAFVGRDTLGESIRHSSANVRDRLLPPP